MKVKFNHIERVAGLFIVIALTGAIVFMGVAAVKKGWFQQKVTFKTHVQSADGLRPGTPVTISGIRAGEITDVILLSADKIIVEFQLFKKFHKQIRKDSQVNIIRPFVIGDREIEITVGSPEAELLAEGTYIESQVSFDMMDLVSGKKLGPFMGTLEGMLKNVSVLAKAFSDPKRSEAFVKMFDRLDPLILNLNKMSQEVTKLSTEFNVILPQLREESPQVGQKISQLINQLNTLTAAIAPAFKEMSPEMPRVSKRAVEALDEMVITLKAMQKSFFLSGKVKDVKEEEIERQRKPSAE